jgi:protein CpxP
MNKKLISALLLTLSMPLTAIALEEPQGGLPRHHGQKIERLTEELGLNAEQKVKVEAIFKEQKEKFKAIHKETRTRLETVLTPEQITKLDEIHKNRYESHWGLKKGDKQ